MAPRDLRLVDVDQIVDVALDQRKRDRARLDVAGEAVGQRLTVRQSA